MCELDDPVRWFRKFARSFLETVYDEVKRMHDEGVDIISVSIDNYMSLSDAGKNTGWELLVNWNSDNRIDTDWNSTSVATVAFDCENRNNRRCEMHLKRQILQSGSTRSYDQFMHDVKGEINTLIDEKHQLLSVSFSTPRTGVNSTWCLILYCGFDDDARP